MSIILILVSVITSLIVGYFIASPFLEEKSGAQGVYPEYFKDSRNESYKEALENLDYALQSKVLSELEYQAQKELLLKDVANLISDK